MKLGGPVEDLIRLPVSAEIVSWARVKPATAFFGLVKRGQVIERRLSVCSTDGQPLAKLSATTPHAKVVVEPGDAPNVAVVRVTLRAPAKKGALRAEITITPSDDKPPLRVPLFAQVW